MQCSSGNRQRSKTGSVWFFGTRTPAAHFRLQRLKDWTKREYDADASLHRGMGVRGLSSYVAGCQRACSEHVELNADADDEVSGSERALMRRNYPPEYMTPTAVVAMISDTLRSTPYTLYLMSFEYSHQSYSTYCQTCRSTLRKSRSDQQPTSV